MRHMMDRKRLIQLAGGFAIAIAMMFTSAPATAQFGQAAGIAKSTQPEYFRRDMTIFADGLELDETQSVIVEGLFEDYIAEFDEGFARLQERLENLRPDLQNSDQNTVMKLVFEPFYDWFDEYDNLGEQFLANIQAVLNQQQLSHWDAFRRRLRRDKTLMDGALPGEKLNLVHVVRDMRLLSSGRFDDSTIRQMQQLMLQYEIDLDQALQRRNDVIKQSRAVMIESIQDSQHEKSLDLIRRQVQYRVQIRDVNFRYVTELGAYLPEDLLQELNEVTLKKAYPRIYRSTPVQRMFKAAVQMELEPDVLAQIQGLMMAYAAELDGLNIAILELSKQTDPEVALGRAEDFAKRMRNEKPERREDKTRPLFKQRDDLGLVYMGLLSDLLTPDQFAALPGSSRLLNQIDSHRERTTGRAAAREVAEPTKPPTRPDRQKGGFGAGGLDR